MVISIVSQIASFLIEIVAMIVVVMMMMDGWYFLFLRCYYNIQMWLYTNHKRRIEMSVLMMMRRRRKILIILIILKILKIERYDRYHTIGIIPHHSMKHVLPRHTDRNFVVVVFVETHCY